MRVIKRKDAGRYERITGANGAGKQRQIRGRHRPRRGVALVVRAARPAHGQQHVFVFVADRLEFVLGPFDWHCADTFAETQVRIPALIHFQHRIVGAAMAV